MKEKIFLMYIKTGGGHLAPARSVANYINSNYSASYETVLIDGLEGASPFIRFSVEDGYRLLQNRAKWYYEMLYFVNKCIGLARLNNCMITRTIKPLLEERILKEKPSKIILFHFFLIEPVTKILKEHNLKIPLITAVTDPFTAHPVWFLNKETDFIVFSPQLKDYAIKKGVDKDRIFQFPFVLDEKYSHKLKLTETKQLKEKYGFDQNKKLILILGGGDGIPKGKAILHGLLYHVESSEIAIVCGRNRELYKFACRLKEKRGYDNLRVYGFVDFIYELINISDLVITKCGASTFMEILLSNKIPVVNSYIWEQEKGNVEFLINNSLGVFERNVLKLPQLINKLLNDSILYNSYLENISRANLENGTGKVGDFIACRYKESAGKDPEDKLSFMPNTPATLIKKILKCRCRLIAQFNN